jgi:hypothetical protein
MDKVALLLEEISRMPEVASLDRAAPSFLNDVAEVYERHGGGATRAFLLAQIGRRNKPEVPVLLKLVEKLDSCPEVRTNRAIGRQIIKCLSELKKGARR